MAVVCVILLALFNPGKNGRNPEKPSGGRSPAIALHEVTPKSPDPQTAGIGNRLDTLRISATKGDASAQLELARIYATGEGVEREMSEALLWYRLAADQGDAEAQVALGVIFENGIEVTQDTDEAVKWYRRAEAGGSKKAHGALQRLGY